MAHVRPSSTISLCAVPAEVELALTSRRFTVRIRVRGTECRLLGPDVPELKHLLDKPSLGPGRLVLELEQAGICLSPSDDDAVKVVVPRGSGKTGEVAVIKGARGDANAFVATKKNDAKTKWTLKERYGGCSILRTCYCAHRLPEIKDRLNFRDEDECTYNVSSLA